MDVRLELDTFEQCEPVILKNRVQEILIEQHGTGEAF